MAEDEEKSSIPFSQLLPGPVKRRINALKKLQLESLELEAQFFIDVFKLECKYHSLSKDLYDKREQIITGKVEPTDEECSLPQHLQESDPEPEQTDVVENISEKMGELELTQEITPGIPDFWLTIFKNVELLNDMVQPHDEAILKFLTDVQVDIIEDSMVFILKFIFAPNPYFTNTILTKEYGMRCSPDENDPWGFEGPEIYTCKGCSIRWRNAKVNVTLKTVRKRQRHKQRGAVRTIVKSVQNDSFFNFFSPPVVSEGSHVDDETTVLLTSDFEIGHYIREKIVPHAVLYYTGEALDDEFIEESSESDDEDSDNDGDEEDFDESGGEEGEGDTKKDATITKDASTNTKDGTNKEDTGLGESLLEPTGKVKTQPQDCTPQ